MDITEILSPESTFSNLRLSSKKKVLEKISNVMSEAIDCPNQEIYESLLSREKLGSTALGDGIAIPHGRLNQLDKAISVFILLDDPIDYDSPDDKPVDIIFAIMVPQNANNEQLKYLAQIAKILSEGCLVSQIRNAHSDQALYEIIEKGLAKITD